MAQPSNEQRFHRFLSRHRPVPSVSPRGSPASGWWTMSVSSGARTVTGSSPFLPPRTHAALTSILPRNPRRPRGSCRPLEAPGRSMRSLLDETLF